MASPRFGLGWMMAVVAIAALDCGAYRACYHTYWTNDAARANQLDCFSSAPSRWRTS